MFAVYRTDSDGCTYSSDTLLFVTATEQTAKDAVTLAELELEAALAVVRPTWTIEDIETRGSGFAAKLLDEYYNKLTAIFTIDAAPEGQRPSVDKNTSYYYEAVEVR